MCVFADLPQFDVIDGFAVDSMHAVFHGVFRDLLQRIIKSFSTGKTAQLDNRLMNVDLPHEVPRDLRPLAEFTRANWRVSELRTVAYLAPILFLGLLPASQYENLVLFTTAIYYLHSSSVHSTDLPKCQRQIQRFSRQLLSIYKDKAIYTYNLHVLLHLTHKVEQAGPLHSHSCDEFEMLFAKMLLVQHGSRGAAEQIMRYCGVRSAVDRTSLGNAVQDEQLSELCKKICSKNYCSHVTRINPKTTLLGPAKTKRLQRLPGCTLISSADNFYFAECYAKCLFDNHVYRTYDNCLRSKRVDCYLYYCKKFYVIQHIALIDNKPMLICNRLSVRRLRTLVPNAKLELRYPLYKITATPSIVHYFELKRVFAKCCRVRLFNETYLLPLPTLEHQS